MKPKVLVVDDEPTVRTIVRLYLSKLGLEIFEAECGLKALAAIRENRLEDLDVLLTDIHMPNMDGITLAEQCKRYYPNVKIVFMSGYSSVSLPEGSPVRHCHVIPKPFRPDVLSSTVLMALASDSN